MSLTRIMTPLTIARRTMFKVHGEALPAEARVQLRKPAESGSFLYARNWSRDKNYDLSKAPQKGDTPLYFFLRRLGHAYEVYPILALTAVWGVLFTYATVTAFSKIEIWFDRSKTEKPWAWSRIRDNYYKMHTLNFDSEGITHRRLEIMEKLQDEMAAASAARGGASKKK